MQMCTTHEESINQGVACRRLQANSPGKSTRAGAPRWML